LVIFRPHFMHVVVSSVSFMVNMIRVKGGLGLRAVGKMPT